jgi:signal transduction histidine kinase
MLVSAAWIGPALLAAVNHLAQARFAARPAPSLRELLFEGGDWLLYAFLTPAVFALARRWPLCRPHLARRAALHLGFALVFCAAWAGAGTALKAALLPAALQGQPGMYFVAWLFVTLPFGVAVYLAVVGVEHAARYFAAARAGELQVARLAEQLAGARLAALQAQVNPHFLFNTLNTIAVLVRDDDRRGATRMIEQLSAILRRTLGRHRPDEVPLAEELDLVRQYLGIEQARFPDRLRPELEIEEAALAAAVPSFAVQHLVENAVRHGIARRPAGGRLRIAARRQGDLVEVSVADDGAGIGPEPSPAGHGLEQTRERLRALYGARASLAVAPAAAGGTVATLRIPYRRAAAEADVGGR